MDIYHTKNQTENISRSCSYLLLKTLFYFISQCTSAPYLESGLCKLDQELDNCTFSLILPRNRPFNECNYGVCKYKTFGYTGLFSLHIERPSYIANTTNMQCRELLCRCSCNIYACWPSVTTTNTTAVQTCLLVECCCKMDACWTVATQSACLLTFCHVILHGCWRCASLSAIPAGMVSHYQPCLLVWYLTISRACWCGASL